MLYFLLCGFCVFLVLRYLEADAADPQVQVPGMGSCCVAAAAVFPCQSFA